MEIAVVEHDRFEKTWLSHVRHELRTPVNAIIGYSEMILEELEAQSEFPDSVSIDITEILQDGHKLLLLINTVFELDLTETSYQALDLNYIRLEFRTPIQTISDRVRVLLENPALRVLHSDLQRVIGACQKLTANIENIIDVSMSPFSIGSEESNLQSLTSNDTHPELVEGVEHTLQAIERERHLPPQAKVSGKILIVDDKETNRALLSRRLQTQGFEIDTADNGRMAIDKVASQTYDLILLDILMPEMNGFETLVYLKENRYSRDIPIIIISALDEINNVAKCIELGAEDYLFKPFNLILLNARISASLEKKYLRDREKLYVKTLAKAHQELLLANRELERMAMLDGLTQVANRRRFDDWSDREWQRHLREREPLSLILLDIDFFKQYNDTYGHLRGDDCLKQVAQAISASVRRGSDLVARYGGEEFAVILANTALEGAREVAEAIRAAIAVLDIEHSRSQASTCVTASLGVTSLIPSVECSLANFIQLADSALYEAKKNGRNQVFAY